MRYFLVFIFLTFSLGGTFAQENSIFKDVHVGDWFYTPVNFLEEQGWISGYKDKNGVPTGFFKPAGPVTKAEVTKMGFLMSGAIEDNMLIPKNKHAKSHWAKHWIALAEGLDIHLWDGNVDPNQKATRAEVLRLIFEILDYEPAEKLISDFPDVAPDHRYFRYIQGAKDLGIISGYPDGTFRPESPISRAEVAKIITRFYKKLVKREVDSLEQNLETVVPVEKYEKYATSYISKPFEFSMQVPGFYRFKSFAARENELMRFGFTSEADVREDNVAFWLKIIGTDDPMTISIRKRLGGQVIFEFPRKGFSRSFFRLEGSQQYEGVMKFLKESIQPEKQQINKDSSSLMVPDVIRKNLKSE